MPEQNGQNKRSISNTIVHQVDVGRTEGWTDTFTDEVYPEALTAKLSVHFDHDLMPPNQSGHISAEISVVGEFAEQSLRDLERMADLAFADALEAIALELRDRATK